MNNKLVPNHPDTHDPVTLDPVTLDPVTLDPVTLDPVELAEKYVQEIAMQVAVLDHKPRVIGLIASEDTPSLAYAAATKRKFDDIGIHYELRQVERLQLESVIAAVNQDETIHGIFIYFPIFNNQQDNYLRNQVDYRKDIEAGCLHWTQKLYANERTTHPDTTHKAVLPCTPLAIVKILTELGHYQSDTPGARPLQDKIVTIFNRSEVIGRPLAMMMSNDGAKVFSFDLQGPLEFVNAQPNETTIDRTTALKQSDIVITGVPGHSFEKLSGVEIKTDAICINFSSNTNFAADITDYTSTYIPRIGPMTVAMCMRNTLRLYNIFHHKANG